MFKRVVQEEATRKEKREMMALERMKAVDKETHIARFVILEKQTTPDMSYATTSNLSPFAPL